VAAQLGYCGLDRQRLPLRGDEIRSCWEGRPGTVLDEPVAPIVPVEPVHRLRSVNPSLVDRTKVRRLEFVPVDEPPTPEPRRKRAGKPAPPPAAPQPAPISPEPRWSLWGDLEP